MKGSQITEEERNEKRITDGTKPLRGARIIFTYNDILEIFSIGMIPGYCNSVA